MRGETWFASLLRWLARRLDPGAETALHTWQQAAEQYLVEQGELQVALRKAMDALAKHDDWCGYNPEAPGDSSFNRAWDAFNALGLSRAANSQAQAEA